MQEVLCLCRGLDVCYYDVNLERSAFSAGVFTLYHALKFKLWLDYGLGKGLFYCSVKDVS